LFADRQARNTIALWFAFFLNLFAFYSIFSWLPTMLSAEGRDIAVATRSLAAYNFGGIAGAIALALAIPRWGSRWPLIVICAGSAISAFSIRGAIDDQSTAISVLITLIGVHGFCVNAVQSVMYAVCAHVYPTHVRTTGTASAAAIGRVGAFLSAFSGIPTVGGAAFFFAVIGFAVLGVMAALMMLRKHIPARA
jgi:AAHS family 4-hydroxybenzoate transporter-like MFS transporter